MPESLGNTPYYGTITKKETTSTKGEMKVDFPTPQNGVTAYFSGYTGLDKGAPVKAVITLEDDHKFSASSVESANCTYTSFANIEDQEKDEGGVPILPRKGQIIIKSPSAKAIEHATGDVFAVSGAANYQDGDLVEWDNRGDITGYITCS